MNTTANHSPGNFPDRVEAEGIVVKYSDLHEIQQGSPYIGKLSVNGVLLSGLFGGPALIARNAVYAPRFVKSEWKFELCRITPSNRAVTPLVSPQHVVWLERIEDGILYFHRDLYGSELSELDLGTGEVKLVEIVQPQTHFAWSELGVLLLSPFMLVYFICQALIVLPYILGVSLWQKITGKE